MTVRNQISASSRPECGWMGRRESPAYSCISGTPIRHNQITEFSSKSSSLRHAPVTYGYNVAKSTAQSRRRRACVQREGTRLADETMPSRDAGECLRLTRPSSVRNYRSYRVSPRVPRLSVRSLITGCGPTTVQSKAIPPAQIAFNIWR